MATNKAEFVTLQDLYNEINVFLKKKNWTKKDAEKVLEAFDHLKYYASMKEQFNQLIERSLSYNGAGCNKLHKKVLKFVHMGKLNIVKITGLNDSYPNWTDGDLQIITSVVQHPECYVEEHSVHYGTMLRRFRAHLDKNSIANKQQCREAETAFCKTLSINL